MFFVSTVLASPASFASWSCGMSVLTVALKAARSSGIRGISDATSACSLERREHPLLAGPGRSRPAVAGSGVDEGLRPGHVLDAGRDVDASEAARVGRVGLVADRDLDVDRHPAQRVHDLLEAVEVDLDEVLDVEPVDVAQDLLQPVVSAGPVVAGHEVGPVADRGEERVDLLRVDAARIGVAERSRRQRDVDGVARQAEHRDLLGDRVDRDDDQRVGVVGAFLRPLVGADQEDVQALLAVPWRDRDVRQRGALDRRLGDAGAGRVGRRRRSAPATATSEADGVWCTSPATDP